MSHDLPGVLVAFLGAAVSVAPFVNLGRRPRLYADGTHDDAPALQALFDGREVFDVRRRQVVRPPFSLANGTYYLSRTVTVNGNNRTVGTISNCTFTGPPQ